jgi:molybdate transport system regulatory protein
MAEVLSAVVSLERPGLPRVALARVALIEAIGELGSISAAARRTGLSYQAAWDAVQALNNLFDGPLVTAAPGGRRGGAAVVTERGQAALQAFRRVQAELDAALARLDQAVEPDLVWSLGMKTSARNALRGRIARLAAGVVSTAVTLALGEGLEIVAVVTRQSAAELGLAVGAPAIALIKSSFVVLAKGENLRTSARNQISGAVVSREDGAVMSEVRLDIGAGKTLAATITLESAEALDLRVGDPVLALVKAPHVILAVE